MSNPSASELQDALASTQALIDQARAHAAHSSYLWTAEFAKHIEEQLDIRQATLDHQKRMVDRLFS